jgi:hypothetical protein
VNDEQIDEIEQRKNAASGGPWHAVDLRHQRGGQIRIFPAPGEGYIVANVLAKGDRPAEDAEFIAHAYEDVEVLLAEVKRLRGAS